jgi:hypothetical protein
MAALRPVRRRALVIASWFAALAGFFSGLTLTLISIAAAPRGATGGAQPLFAYVGTLIGIPGFVLLFFQTASLLRRKSASEDPIARLRARIRDDLDDRLRVMRLAGEDIELRYGSPGDTRNLLLDDLQDRLTHGSRLVFLGPAGCGKSYSALRVGLWILRTQPDLLPILVPLSQWDETTELRAWLATFLQSEFNLSQSSSLDLLGDGKFVFIFDGLDETCSELADVSPANRFLRQVVDWRVLDRPAQFFLTCRDDVWSQVDSRLRRHHTLMALLVRPVSGSEAKRFLARALGNGGTADSLDGPVGQSSGTKLKESGGSPWKLSMIVAILKADRSHDSLPAGLSGHAVVAEFVRATAVAAARGRRSRLVASIDLWWLARYARYLSQNRTRHRAISRVRLPTRDLELHRLWPAAGIYLPRIVDMSLALALSLPGLAWGISFLWKMGPGPRAFSIFFALAWLALLFRTTTKAWVRPATQDFSRLQDRRFVLRQATASLILGFAGGLVAGPLVGGAVFVTAWLAVGLTVGFGQTLATDSQARVVGPLGVLARERRVSRLAAWSVFPILALGFSGSLGPIAGPVIAACYVFVTGETVGCALWRRYVAMNIASVGRLPFAPAHCFARLHRLGFVRVAGRSYQFRHDDLLTHFAAHNGGPFYLMRGQ